MPFPTNIMQVALTLSDLNGATAALRAAFGHVAMVPTMGALHDGHRALVEAAVATGAGVIASIFVNPTQFAATEDLSRYPRDELGDLASLRGAGCHLAWLPEVGTMYPPGDATTIEVAGPARRWEGDVRPGHFRGVATVCARLFGHARPDAAFFGEKDWQQLQVVRRMCADLPLPTAIIGVPTVRETDGLAMSSRNRFLSPAERALAPLLHAALRTAAGLKHGEAVEPVLRQARAMLTEAGFSVEYLDVVDGPTLEPLTAAQPGARLIAAARLGSVRLLDNLGLD